MDLRTNYSRLTTLQVNDNKQVWQDCYTEDIVRRISGLDPLVGRDACQKQVQAFLDGLKGPLKHDQIALAFDDENNVTIAEFDQSFIDSWAGADARVAGATGVRTCVTTWRSISRMPMKARMPRSRSRPA